MGLLLNLVMVAAGLFVGFGWFYWMVSSQLGTWLYLERLGDKLRFFFSPYGPRNIVVLTRLSGDAALYVNAEIKATKEGYIITTPEGVIHTPMLRKHILSILESAIVPRVPSPYGLGWRAMAGWMMAFIWGYYAVVLLTPEIGPNLDFVVPIILLFNIVIYMAGVVLSKLTTPNIEVYSLVARSVNPPTINAIPAVGPLGISPIEAAKFQGLEINIKVDKEAVKAMEEIKEALGVDVHAAAELLTSAHLLRLYRQKIASILARITPLIEAERITSRIEMLRLAVPRLIIIIAIFGLGLLVGWALGGGDIVFAPAAP